MKKLVLLAAITAAAAGCGAQNRAFEPAAGEQREVNGQQALAFAVFPTAAQWGQLWAWTTGASYLPHKGEKRTVIRVGAEIKNAGSPEFLLDASASALTFYTGRQPTAAEPVRSAAIDPADTVIPAGAVRRYELSFTLPPGVKPGDVQSFRMVFVLTRANERAEVHADFGRLQYPVPPRAPWSYYRYDPFYPSFYPSWYYYW